MKPEARSRYVLAITRAKAKMFELGVDEADHLEIPQGVNPSQLLVLAVASLGDVAVRFIETAMGDWGRLSDLQDDVGFAATYFDAFQQAKLGQEITNEVNMLASAAYYLADRPGSSFVLAKAVATSIDDSDCASLLKWILRADWRQELPGRSVPYSTSVEAILTSTREHFFNGTSTVDLILAFDRLRAETYSWRSDQDLLYADVAFAILKKRISSSAWLLLPQFTGIQAQRWKTAIQRGNFPKELWPSQVRLGLDGFYSGQSGIIQMPTSAGKTRAIEIILRSAFLMERASIAIVIAPFRALCHEICNSLRGAFYGENTHINELSDILDTDMIVAGATTDNPWVLVLTPEKFLYLLRQSQDIVQQLGLVVYDEGHQFDTGSRGITYELLLTEIKHLLPAQAQSVLVSAVIRNAQAVGEWLIGSNAKVATGTGLLPTSRSVAFPSWRTDTGRLFFFDSGTYETPDYFVPKVIVSEVLQRRGRESTQKVFPVRGHTGDLALYLGLRLTRSGAVAIFCGTKRSANALLKRAVEIYSRGLSVAAPATFGSPEEIARLSNLLDLNFGANSLHGAAARLGVFVHHAAIPHGTRVALEHAMHRSLVKFVICTSTLAQGVNMPIRYLVVASTVQAGEPIKVRDFQNLIGRAGRSGMHTEGLIVFSDVAAVDARRTNPFRFQRSVELLDPDQSEATSSSLLELVRPFRDAIGNEVFRPSSSVLAEIILGNEEEQMLWAQTLEQNSSQFDAGEILSDLSQRKRLLRSVESYLMANRGVSEAADFILFAQDLATRTLGYFLADEETRLFIVDLFRATAEYLEANSHDELAQSRYSKTLLGIQASIQVEQWTVATLRQIDIEQTPAEWVVLLWPLIEVMVEDPLFTDVEPADFAFKLVLRWLEGDSYGQLFGLAREMNATKLFGTDRRTAVGDETVASFLENILGFQVALIVAAVGQTLESIPLSQPVIRSFRVFQRSLKYGLPDLLASRCFEGGFGDRELAKRMRNVLRSLGIDEQEYELGLHQHRSDLLDFLRSYPDYFTHVLRGIVG